MKNNFELIPLNSVLDFKRLVSGFDCDHDGINKFLLTMAEKLELERRLTTFLLIDNDKDKLVAFYSTTVGSLDNTLKDNNEISEVETHKFLNLAYFAVDRSYHKKGIGTSLIKELFKTATLVSYYVGIEMIYLESVDDAVDFYKSVGFQLSKPLQTPEAYHKNGIDTSKIGFDMFITVNDLLEKGYLPNDNSISATYINKNSI